MARKKLSSLAATALIALAIFVMLLPGASAAERVRVRGSVVGLSGNTLSIKTREGESVDIALADGWMVSGMAPASLSDIKPGDFLGIASLPRSGGGDGALEVLVFPPALKGTGEGSYGWDLQPNSTMTNGTVDATVTAADGPSVKLSYKGGEKTIVIPEGTPIVTFGPATPADLKPGAAIFLIGEKTDAGTISARRVTVETNGVKPPM